MYSQEAGEYRRKALVGALDGENVLVPSLLFSSSFSLSCFSVFFRLQQDDGWYKGRKENKKGNKVLFVVVLTPRGGF
jgi:hypothetical protein